MGARNFYNKITTDPSYLAQFAKDPIGVLASEGITLSAKNQQELQQVLDELLRPYKPGHGPQARIIP